MTDTTPLDIDRLQRLRNAQQKIIDSGVRTDETIELLNSIDGALAEIDRLRADRDKWRLECCLTHVDRGNWQAQCRLREKEIERLEQTNDALEDRLIEHDNVEQRLIGRAKSAEEALEQMTEDRDGWQASYEEAVDEEAHRYRILDEKYKIVCFKAALLAEVYTTGEAFHNAIAGLTYEGEEIAESVAFREAREAYKNAK